MVSLDLVLVVSCLLHQDWQDELGLKIRQPVEWEAMLDVRTLTSTLL